MFMAIDVGNTNVAIGVHDHSRWIARWRISTSSTRTADEWAAVISELLHLANLTTDHIDHIGISSVVPSVTTELRNMAVCHFHLDPFVVAPGVRTGIQILTDNPKEVGADRVVNALATREKYGGPAIVVDFGTATTFDVISKEGNYVGGAIAPGIVISAEALRRFTAKLHEVELVPPPKPIGKNTVEAMQSGIVLGYAAMVNGLVAAIREQVGPCKVIGTGGLVGVVSQATKIFDYIDPDLTIDGIRFMYYLNTPKPEESLHE